MGGMGGGRNIMMNLVNSKVIKSSRPVVNRSSESVSAYSCELFIESFKILHRGFVYFLWSSNHSQIHSLRYEANGKSVQVKETLTISLRITAKNGRDLPSSTFLKLMAESGEELDEFEITMNGLTPQFREMEVPMDRGLVNIRVRRKLMNIGEEEEINFQGGFYRSMAHRIEEKSLGNVVSGEYESLHEELTRTKKELEDAEYLNNKLKNDREVLMVSKQELQLEIETMIIQITKEISVLREHYDSRMSIRQHCYEEEIEEMVNVFNANADQTKKIMEIIMRQKIKLEEEMRPLHERIRVAEGEVAARSAECAALGEEKIQLEIRLTETEEAGGEKERAIEALTLDRTHLHEQLSSRNNHIDTLNIDISTRDETIADLKATIADLGHRINQDELHIQQKDQHIFQLQSKILQMQEREKSHSSERELLEKQMGLLEEQKKGLLGQVQSLTAKLQEFQYEMQFNENVMGQLKRQQAQKEEQLYAQLDSLENAYAQKMQDILSTFQREKDELLITNQSLQQERQQQEEHIRGLEQNIKGSQLKLTEMDQEINHLSNEVRHTQGTTGEKDDTIRKLMKEIDDLHAEIEHLKAPALDRKPSERKLEQVEVDIRAVEVSKTVNQQLTNKNSALEAQVQRLAALIDKLSRETDRLKADNLVLEDQLQRKMEERSYKSPKHSKRHSEHEVQAIFKNGPINQDEVIRIVDAKEREISELRFRVDYLEKIYEAISDKLDEIARKYPHIEIGTLPVPMQKVQEYCQSEQEEERILNNIPNNGNPASPEPNSAKLNRRLSKKESIGAAIMEKDEDSLSNPSAKIDRRWHEPRSEQKISDGYKRGIIRRESMAGRVTIEVPRDIPSIKREQSHGSYEASERSGTSLVKVSHTKKIKDLEGEVRVLNDRLKDYEVQIGNYNKSIDGLKKQLQTVKAAEKRPQQTKKESKESQVFFQDERLKNFMHESQLKEFQIQKMNLRVGELEDTLKNQKAEVARKSAALDLKVVEYEKRIEEVNRRLEGVTEINRNLQKLNEQLEEKLRKERETGQESRLSMKELQMHLDNAQGELKKLKSLNEALQERVQKLMGSDAVIKDLTREVEDLNKKALEQTRVINHLKLEKDAVQEELRLLKKRQNDHIRVSTEWEEKAASLERSIEEQKRKEGKFKREIDELQEEVRRAKLNTKKAEEELQAINSAQISWQAERRKHLDEISNLQDQISRKDYEFTKLSKEIEKWKARAEEKEDARLGRKSELRQEIDRLESELIRREKKLLEETEENKLLRGRLELLQRENKRIMEQKNQSYGQKLKYYVEEMSNIKKLLSEYQDENSRLKIDNNQLYEQLEILRINYDKLQIKYDENMEREETILTDLQSYINQVSALKDRLAHAHSELDQAESAFLSIRKEVDEEKLQARRMNEKLETSERNYERAALQLREMKIRISEYETNNEINGKMGERYRLLQRKKGELEEEFRRVKSEYDNLINVFVFKREDLEKAVAEARTQERRLKDEEVLKINEECSKLITSKTQRLQQEIMDIYNENNRLRAENQVLMQQSGRMKGRVLELQMTTDRFSSLQNENETYRYSMDELKDQLRKKGQRISKLELSVQAVEAECNSKERDIISQKTRIQELEKTIEKLANQLSERKASERELQDAVLRAGQSKDREKSQEQFFFKQRESQLTQQYESKLRALQAENQGLRERAARSVEQHNMKIKKLEQKMDEMEEALKEREKAIETNYEAEIHELENELVRLSHELEEKMIRIDELNDGILILQDENKDLTKEIQELKYQFEEERQILDAELTRLKNKLKEAETTYAANLKSLQEEVLKNAQKTNISGSRVKTSEAEDRIAKRYEDKLKNKDRKIEELKENIYALEETVVKFRKKENGYETTLSQVERLKISIVEFERERKNIEVKYEQQLNRNADTLRELRREILLTKESQERLRLLSQQKIFENESISCELKTMRELYQQLQRELQKRKNTLTAQLQQESSVQFELRTKESKIIQLEERLMDLSKSNKELQVQVKRKSIEIKKYIEIINEFQRKQQKYIQDIAKMANDLTTAKKNSQQLNNMSEMSKNEVNKMKNELIRLRKNQEQLRSTCVSKEEAATQLRRLYDDLSLRYKEADELSQKYTIINERSRQHLGYGIQQIIDRFLMHLEEKDAEISQLIEEVEQLKFLNERKYLDYDELKKENIELQLKAQDLQLMNDQLQTLRKICDKLEQQKKNSVFREEVLRMQLQNLANAGAPELRNRIEAILNNPTVPSYTNFSFYNM